MSVKGKGMQEEWKRLIYNNKDYGNLYLVSNFGRIKNAKTNYIRKACCSEKNPYPYITFVINEKIITIKIHRAVAENFIPNPDNLPQVNHIDGNKRNNCVNNLEWVTAKQNVIHAVINDLYKNGESSELSKLNKEQVEYIKENCILYNKEFGCTALAEKFNVDVSTISKIIHDVSWKKYDYDYELIQNTINVQQKGRVCKKCGKFFIPIHKCQVYCSKICSSISQQKVKRPSKEELLELIKSTSFLQIGKIYGVSDNAVRKWCKSYGLPYKQKDIRSL